MLYYYHSQAIKSQTPRVLHEQGMTRSSVQPQRAPLENYMATQLARLSNEARVYLGCAGGTKNTSLEEFAKKVMTSYQRMVRKLTCKRDEDVQVPPPASQGQQTRTSQRAVIERSKSSRARCRDDEDKDDEDDDDINDPTYDQDELTGSQLADAPQGTQTQFV
ncbi:uncharacterized protein [Miscanthus floridulus]|uniref:uncharacterized protein n=1 Tax=Miscanthus floridulus TaxID=154761 RepID=UPI00345B257A